ncbi:MAG TPA: MarC family protein [Terriglobales bacterium]|nr:MarC family protein [Terriglobales bacterium]
MLLVLKFFALAYSALLPVINPLGSALMFLTVVGSLPTEQFRYLARKVAVSMVLFLLVFEVGGAALLNFFGISLPVVQLAGGLVLAAMGWRILDQKETANGQSPSPVGDSGTLNEKIFFPLTFPISAGPACIVVTLTLSAHASRHELFSNVMGHLGMALAIVALGVTIWLCYVYASRITQKIAPATIHGILRVVAFVLLCIGVQIASNGVEAIVKAVAK